MALIDVQRSVVSACFGPEPRAEELAALGDARIWRIYRDSIRNRLRGELKVAFKRTYAAAEASFERAFAEFLSGAPPRTRYFHAVVGCFAESAVAFFARDPEAPAFTADLCAYEAALWTVSDLPDAAPEASAEFAFDRRPLLAPALRFLTLGHTVHEPPAVDNGYAAREVYLCVHRRPEEKKARTWAMNAVTSDLMQRFASSDETVAEAVQQVAHKRGIAVDEAFIDGLCTVLADFIDRGVILGAR
jgi:hypothetical protein